MEQQSAQPGQSGQVTPRRPARSIALLLMVGLLTAAIWVLLFIPTPSLTEPPPRFVTPLAPLEHPHAYLAIPIVIPVDTVKRHVREALSEELFKSQIKVPGRKLKITVERNGPLVLWLRKARLHMELPLEFEIEGDLDTDGEITLISDARFNVTSDWMPELDVENTFRWDWQPRVGFWPIRIRIGDRLAPYIRKALDAEEEKMEQAARERFKLRAMAQAGWEQLQTPLSLGAEGNEWLVLKPESAWLEPVTSDDVDIFVNMWIGAQPRVITGAKPPEPADKIALPELQKGDPPGRNMVLDHALRLTYAEAASEVGAKLLGRPLPIDGGTFEIETLEFYPSGAKLVLDMEIRARRDGVRWPAKGTMQLLATPVYDVARGQLRLTEVEWAPIHNNPLTWRSAWVRQPQVAARLMETVIWPMDERVAATYQRISTQLAQVAGKNYELFGGLSHTIPTRPVLTDETLTLELRSIGEAAIMVRP